MDEAGPWILVLTLAAAAVALIVIGRKQAAGTLRRNWIAGLRTSETMRSDEAWRAAHAHTAGLVTAGGVVQLVAAVTLVVARPGQEAGTAVVLGAAAATLGLVLAAGVRGHRIAARVNREQGRG
jgi:uncharacterized membrane protein